LGNNRRARTQAQRQEYHRQARQIGGEDTEIRARAESLEGSDQTVSVPVQGQPQLVDKPSFLGWLKSNKSSIIVGLATAIIAALIGIMIGWFSDLKGQVSYLNLVVSENRSKITELSNEEDDDKYITKEVLELKLELIERDLKGLIPDTEGITKRLEEIEKQISVLQGEGGKEP